MLSVMKECNEITVEIARMAARALARLRFSIASKNSFAAAIPHLAATRSSS
jgi:hypothetical protein